MPPASETLSELPDQDLSSASQALNQALSGGIAFHTSDLSREERSVIERAFRDSRGLIRAIVATSTVAAGVNTPVETVIIVEPSSWPVTGAILCSCLQNMAGRAGRLG